MAVLTTSIDLPENTEVCISTKKTVIETTPSFSCIGGNMNYQTREKQYPELFDVLSELSKAATWMFWQLMKTRNTETNICKFKPANQAQRKTITRAYKELSLLSLVQRTKQNHYMINPKVMLPDRGHYSAAKAVWSAI